VVAQNSATNVTVALETVQGVSAAQANVTESFSASRISNKFVWDWSLNKYRYWLSAPYTDSVSVLSSQPGWQAVTFVRVDNA
jgi:hypothetical protein